MPLALIFIGLILVIAAAQDTYVQLGREIRSDLVGPGSFTSWATAIGMAGAIGYVPPLQRVSIALMSLILMVLLLSHPDFFNKFSAGLKETPKTPAKAGAPTVSPASMALSLDKSTLNLGGKATDFGNWITKLLTGRDPAKAEPLKGVGGVTVDDLLGAWRGPESGAY
jgi:hypothetical protein